MTIEPWAADLVTGAAIVVLVGAGIPGVWYSLRIAWWILSAAGRAAWWLIERIADWIAPPIERAAARRWRDQHALGWNSGARPPKVSATHARYLEAEAERIRAAARAASVPAERMGDLARSVAVVGGVPTRDLIEAAQRRRAEEAPRWTVVDHEAAVPPSRHPIPAATDRARRRWVVRHARALGGGRGSIPKAAEVWEYLHARGWRAGPDEITGADWRATCNCSPMEYETRTFGDHVVRVDVEHEAYCATLRD